MGKIEMSKVLQNLKFMQKAVQIEKKEEEPKADGNFTGPSNGRRKCMVIMEGDPHPGTVRGRMSFQNFNPAIDKLKEEAPNGDDAEASTSSAFQSGREVERENGLSELSDVDTGRNDNGKEHKRKEPGEFSQTSHPKKLQKNGQGNKHLPPSDIRSTHKQSKRDKLDYNVLVRQKSQSKKKRG